MTAPFDRIAARRENRLAWTFPCWMTVMLGVCVLQTSAFAGTVADMDQEMGLPNAKLGAPVENFKGLPLIEDAGRWLTYKQPGEKLSYKGFEVAGIKYNFFKGKLYSINIEVDGKRSVRGILKTLERDFGTDHTLETRHPDGSDTDLETREWAGTKTYLLYKSAANSKGAEIVILDKPAWDLMQVPREQRAAGNRKLMEGSYTNGDF